MPILLTSAAAIAVLMLSVWALSLPVRDVSIVDIAWGIGFILVAWLSWRQHPAETRSLLLPVLVTVWGLRLSIYLLWRNRGQPEDARYGKMRIRHGDSFWLMSLVVVFGLQATVMWIVSLPLQLAHADTDRSLVLRTAGIVIWLTGLFFETVGDWQLAEFRHHADNRGQVLNRGLWRWTRHPNYFGDFCVWWGLFLVAFSAGVPLWTVVSPLVMSITLLRVSGVTLLEKTLVKSKPGYEQYVQTTSAFIPWPPQKEKKNKTPDTPNRSR